RGRSLTPLLDNNSDHVNGGALIHKWLGGTSYIYRTEQYRLIEKYSGNSVSGRELYDLGSNRVEMVNVAGFPEYQIILHELTTSMRREPAAQGVNLVQNASAFGAPSNRALPGLQVSTTPSTAFLDWPSSSGSGSAYDVQYRSNQSQSFAPLAGFQSVIGGAADVPISGSSNYFQVELANNVAPYFVVDPLIRNSAQVGQSYSGSLGGAATDGGSVTYAKEAGPNWLSVAANGNLSGTPQSDDVGANYFTISATDAQGAAAHAKLFINVLAP
ncbi:MAG: putative Ig domain-containing protein, partial [Verrucomicrobiota bacterium]